MAASTSRNFLAIGLVVVIIILAVGSGLLYYQQQGTISSANSQISNLKALNSNANVAITSQSEQISSQSDQLSSQSNQVSSQSNQISTMSGQISSLNSKVSNQSNIISLSDFIGEASSVTVNQPAGALSVIVTFNANYSGYIVYSGTSSTTNGYIQVNQTCTCISGTFSEGYLFGTSGDFALPVYPGTVTVSFYNTNSASSASATISVVYYY
ncbi:MAG TPA: hypothetical protein VJN71_07380 [Nitrososphaerales archaeon]|nr:hypothetical protein [Nitrososphaerales archaeon]